MSIGFQFTADLTDRKGFLQTLEALAEERDCSCTVEEDRVFLNFCPMGDLELTLAPKETEGEDVPAPENGGDGVPVTLKGECVSTPAGPGFHAAAINFIDALQQSTGAVFQIEDETEYYQHRSFLRMRQEHFYPWLSTLVDACRRERENPSLSNFCVCWNMGQYVPEDVPRTVVTPLGRYHIDQLVDQVQNEGIEVFAKEFFIWNEPEKDGRFYLNSALRLLWEDCFFMPGSRSPEDRQVNEAILSLLEQAASMDQTLPMPKREYEQLCRLEDRTPLDLSGFEDYSTDYVTGYRRGNVVYRIGNTDFTIPGNYLQSDGEDSIIWYDGMETAWRSVRVSAFRINEGEAEFSDRLFERFQEGICEFKTGEGRCRAAFAGKVEDADIGSFYQSIAQIICAGQTTLVTASFQQQEDAEWALDLFRNVRSFRSVEI